MVTWGGSRGGEVVSRLVLVVEETCSGMASLVVMGLVVVVVSGVGGRASCVVVVVVETCSGMASLVVEMVVVVEEMSSGMASWVVVVEETCSGKAPLVVVVMEVEVVEICSGTPEA